MAVGTGIYFPLLLDTTIKSTLSLLTVVWFRTPYLVLVSVYRTGQYLQASVSLLKGQCHEISEVRFPQAPVYPIRVVLSFFKNSRRYLQIKVTW
jgi:hypothetical protein